MKKTVQLGFFLSLALILAYIETLIPLSFGIPGIKLGLPNLIVVLLMYQKDAKQGYRNKENVKTDKAGLNTVGQSMAKEAFLINVLRIVLSGFMFSNLYAIMYALAGALLSFTAMSFGKKMRCFSMIGVSVLGGVAHNIGQIVIAILVVETFYVGYYIPFLITAGTITGAVLGLAAMELRPYLMKYMGSEEGMKGR
ncbi:MAG: Gx transporter family protein [Lachnospiraceae bacterium]|nr:Gx transporter family protein [Lachnospiraceae bacterium]